MGASMGLKAGGETVALDEDGFGVRLLILEVLSPTRMRARVLDGSRAGQEGPFDVAPGVLEFPPVLDASAGT
jgi:hypothetical protein